MTTIKLLSLFLVLAVGLPAVSEAQLPGSPFKRVKGVFQKGDDQAQDVYDVQNGQPAIVETDLSKAAAEAVIEREFDRVGLGYNKNPSNGRYETYWHNRGRCSLVGWNTGSSCEEQIVVRVEETASGARAHVQVLMQSSTGRENQWNPTPAGTGKKTSETARKLDQDFRSAALSGEVEVLAVATPAPASAPATTKTISLDQSPDEVRSSFGEPKTIIDLGQRQTYVYATMKVFFVDGKVTDVQ
jgi:hypothetical protein